MEILIKHPKGYEKAINYRICFGNWSDFCSK